MPHGWRNCHSGGIFLKFKLSLRIKKDSSRMTPPVTEALLNHAGRILNLK
jgi:hypothetical protein